MAETLVKFVGRKRTKDASLNLLHLNEDGDIDVKVYIKSEGEYYVAVDHPSWKADVVAAALGRGYSPIEDEELDADDCIEFYQGAGLSRFRGI